MITLTRKSFVASLLAFVCAASSAFAQDAKLKVGDFEFSHGDEFKKVENSSRMVKAKMEFTDKETSEKAKLSFYYFGAGQGGSTTANIERWKKQFNGTPKVEATKMKYGKTMVTIIHATGTYLDGPPFGTKTPRENYALLGAIIEGESAPVFLKMTGAKDAVKAAKKAFEELTASPFGDTKGEKVE